VLEAQGAVNNFQQQNFRQQQVQMNENNERQHELLQQQQRLELAAQSAQMNAAMLQNQLDSTKAENLELGQRCAGHRQIPVFLLQPD
jgi:hypothetical protein